MPQIPALNIGAVDPSGSRQQSIPYQNAQAATPDAFGQDIGQAQTKMSRVLDNTSDVLYKNAQRMQHDDNVARVDNLSMDYTAAQTELDVKFRQLEGREATAAYPQYTKDSLALRKKFSDSLPDDDSRRLFDAQTKKSLARSLHNEAFYAAGQNKKYLSATNERMLKTSTELVNNDPGSEDSFGDALANAQRAVRQEAQLKGWDKAETDAKLKEAESNLVYTRINSLANVDPEAAQALFDKEKGRMLSEQRDTAQASLASGRYKAGSEAAVKQGALRRAGEADIESTMKTGVGVGFGMSQARAAYGEDGAQKWKEAKEDAQKTWWHTHALPTTPIPVMEKQLQNIEPKPGSKDFVREQQVYDAVLKKMTETVKLRTTDPAASVAEVPAVKEAIASGDMNVIMAARMSSQEAAGVPENQRSPITLAEGVRLMAPMNRVMPGEEAKTLKEIAETAKKEFGPFWEKAFLFGVKAAKLNSLNSLAAGATLKKVLEGRTPTIAEAQAIDVASETAEAERAANVSPEPAKPPKKVPLSQRILEGK